MTFIKSRKRLIKLKTISKKARPNIEYGGSLAKKRRRSLRPLNPKKSHHITLKSYQAIGKRSLFRHKKMILKILRKNSERYRVKVYEYAIQGNHLHLLVKGKSREELQNFFRVFAGHTAQNILKDFPILTQNLPAKGGAPETKKECRKNQRKFWSYLIYTRIVQWGRDFKNVVHYIEKNTLELLGLITYVRRPLFKNLYVQLNTT